MANSVLFQHRHYNFLAKVIKEALDKRDSIQSLTATLAARLQEDNPRFDKKRFLDAAFGVTSNARDIRTAATLSVEDGKGSLLSDRPHRVRIGGGR